MVLSLTLSWISQGKYLKENTTNTEKGKSELIEYFAVKDVTFPGDVLVGLDFMTARVVRMFPMYGRGYACSDYP